MVVAMQTLTSLSKEPLIERGRCATHRELEARPDASLAWTSAGEPLNPTPSRLSSAGIGEGKPNPAIEQERGNPRAPAPVPPQRGLSTLLNSSPLSDGVSLGGF